MKIKKVKTEEEQNLFLKIPYGLYAKDEKWIAPLESDVKTVFDPKKNKLFVTGQCKRWILFNDANILIGRIAAFITPKYKNKGDNFKVGGFGFFECIDNQEAANLLLNTAEQWLKKNDCEAMDGPINFGERDKFWGLLIEGNLSPLYGMNYNPLYYKKLFEYYGLQIFYEQYCYYIRSKNWSNEKFKNKYDELIQVKNYTLRPFTKDKIKQFAYDFVEIYNDAWVQHEGNKSMNFKTAFLTFKKIKPIIDNKLSWFLYDQNKPIGFFINIPDLNFYFKKFNGKLNWINKIRLYFMLKFIKNPKIIGMVFGLKQKYQNKGLYALLIVGALKTYNKYHYVDYEMQWIGEFNKKMINFVLSLNPSLTRKLATYRKIFNPKIKFKKHPPI